MNHATPRKWLQQLALAAAVMLLALAPLLSAAPKAKARPKTVPDKIDYERDVKPILADNCMSCHGPDKAKGGLKLTDRATAMVKTKKDHIALVPGKPDESELIKRILTTDLDDRMPPEEKDPLTPVDIQILTKWIAQGAEWSQHWALAPLKHAAPPKVKASSVRNPIDQFVLAELAKHAIAPSPEADRYTLIKRLSYDLTGLPPTPPEVEAFVNDASPKAYENLVERLLASPHFGERWGRRWLDKARYADSDGYEKDRARPDAYVYRDWVINAYNRDMPFDQFTVEQVAGDLLPGARSSQNIATAFNRQTLTNEEGGVDQEEYRVAAVFDRVDTLGTVWLGLSVGCAKCHNHKYDPIAQAEYYSLFAFFNNADEVSVNLPVKATDMDAYEAAFYPLEQALVARKKEIAPLEKQWEEQERAKLLAGGGKKARGPKLSKAEAAKQVKTANPPEAHPLEIISYEAVNGTTLMIDRGTISAEGSEKDPDTETYIVTARTSVEDIKALRLEALTGETLPKYGPGRAENGNFVLTALKVSVIDADGKATPLELGDPDITYTQKGFKGEDALTGDNPKKGWAILGGVGKEQSLTARLDKPTTFGPDQTLRFELQQNYGKGDTLGRFRLSAVTGDLSLPTAIVSALQMYPEKRVANIKTLLFDYYAAQDEQAHGLEDKIEALQEEYKVRTMPVRTMGVSLRKRTTHVFERGNFLAPAAEVTPNTLAVLPPLKASGKIATRLDLARWLVSPANPLTPRVIVNQVWAELFGAGLVRTVNDFGVRGDQPSHPELLDWLAGTFRDDLKWSQKGLIRLIVNSATYRQSSRHRSELAEVDPLNTLLARQNRLRVEGEVVRDLTLSVSGLLSEKVGGPSVFPPMPPELAKLSYAGSFTWKDSDGEDRYRRGMYTFFKRTLPHPSLMTFDCPEANTATVQRSVSNTPLQALTLLNNESFVEASQALARRVIAEGSTDDADRVTRAMRTCLVREPSQSEVARLVDLLHTARDYYKAHADEAKSLAGTMPKDADAQEAAAWVATLRVILNLDEFITRD